MGTGSRFDGIGSGEGGSEFRGEGIWMSTDDGASWTMVEGTSSFLTTMPWSQIPTRRPCLVRLRKRLRIHHRRCGFHCAFRFVKPVRRH